MSAEAAAGVRSWTVGTRGYRCTLTVPRPQPGALMAASLEWEPCLPSRLTQGEINEYLAGRNKALAELSQELGMQTLVIDV